MKVMGIELDSNRLNYVIVARSLPEEANVVASGKLQLEGTRDADALRAFARECRELFKDQSPDAIAVKAKPESGQMRAGAAALKIEAAIMAQSTCPVYFLTSQQMKSVDDNSELYAYQQGAWKAAVTGFEPPTKKAPRATKKNTRGKQG